MENNLKKNIGIAAVLIVVAAVLKVTTFPNSINPIIAIALFSGAIFKDKKLAFIMPLLAMLFSDVLMEVTNVGAGFYGIGQIGNYVCLLAVTFLGFAMKKINVASVAGFSIGSTLLFFFLSNSNVYLFSASFYAPGFAGYMQCLAAGVPFMLKRIPVDLAFSAMFFATYVVMFVKSQKTVSA